MDPWTAIDAHISQTTGSDFTTRERHGVGGGCINTAYALTDGRTRYFVKLNEAAQESMFVAELAGLQEIESSASVRVPSPLCCGTSDGRSYIVMEYLELGGRGDAETLGRQLAAMHRTTRSGYGWDMDNTIGSTPQPNDPADDWTAFWRDRRIGFQLQLAGRKGYGGRLQQRGEALLEGIPALLAGHNPPAALLHGDLWSGNYATLAGGEGPVIFDPAVYFGDREADIAMTELFGGFPARFYEAYNEAYELPVEYHEVRKTLYNLYHVLNHLNLFGGGYASQAETMIGRLLSELR